MPIMARPRARLLAASDYIAGDGFGHVLGHVGRGAHGRHADHDAGENVQHRR